ncbi:hypothetical protein ACVWYS_000168 [Arthrobacter sp. TE12231]
MARRLVPWGTRPPCHSFPARRSLPACRSLPAGLAEPRSAKPCCGPPGSAAGHAPRPALVADISGGRADYGGHVQRSPTQQRTCPVFRSTTGHEGRMSTRAGQPRPCPAATSFSGGHAPLSHGVRGDMSSLQRGAEGVGINAQLQGHKAIHRCASRGARHAHWPALGAPGMLIGRPWGGGRVHSWCRPCSFWVQARVGMLILDAGSGGHAHFSRPGELGMSRL